MELLDECMLIGAAMLAAQKFEFALYGIVSHLSHLPEAQKDKRFRNLTPEMFLRGDSQSIKATLGQLEGAFGEKLMIKSPDLSRFLEDRNLIAHNYWRLTKAKIKGGAQLPDPETFLREFLARCDRWTSIVNGLVYVFMITAAEKEGRRSEIDLSEEQERDVEMYYVHVAIDRNAKVDE